MKINRKDLYSALRTLVKLTEQNHAMPILASVKIDAREGTCTITAIDRFVRTRLSVDLKAEGELSICVDPKQLSKLVKPVGKKKGHGTIEVSADGKRIKVKTESTESMLWGLASEDFPGPFCFKPWEGSKFNGQALKRSLGWVLPSICKDETREHICTVHVETDAIVSTDGHRMHVAPSPITVEKPLLLRNNAAKVLFAMLGSDQGWLDRDHDVATFRSGSWRMETKLVPSEFPPWREVLPKDKETSCTVDLDAKMFAETLNRAQNVNKSGVRFCVNGAFVLTAEDPDLGETSETVPTRANDHTGNDLIIGFNPRYLIDAMKGQTDAKLRFGGDALSPLRIDLPDDLQSVIMPMRL